MKPNETNESVTEIANELSRIRDQSFAIVRAVDRLLEKVDKLQTLSDMEVACGVVEALKKKRG